MVGDADHDGRADDETDGRAADGAQCGRARAEGVGTQHGQGARARPRNRADTFVISTTATASAEPGRAPHRVAEPHGTEGEVREPVGGRRDGPTMRRACSPVRSLAGSAPAASSAASATMPTAIAEGAGMKAGVQRTAGDAPSSRPRPRSAGRQPGLLPPTHRRHVGGQLGLDERIQTTGGLSDGGDESRVADGVCRAVADQSRPPCRSVSADASITALASARSLAKSWSTRECRRRGQAECSATHSTRPTSLDSATAPEAAPVGG